MLNGTVFEFNFETCIKSTQEFSNIMNPVTKNRSKHTLKPECMSGWDKCQWLDMYICTQRWLATSMHASYDH